ncbi:hypothetical protein V2J09_014480 [Rumex salicifolius]
MATTEAASATPGPRYAPEDPTLPQPWKGLIDGSSGVTYYWNPETNVTQYERPASVSSALPSAPAPGSNVLHSGQMKLSQTMSSSGLPAHSADHGARIAEVSHQQPQYLNQSSQQHGQPQGPVVGQQIHQQASPMFPMGQDSQQGQGYHQNYANFGQGMLPPGQTLLHQGQIGQQQYGQQMGKQVSQQILPQSSHPGQRLPQGSHLGQQLPQEGQQTPQQVFQQTHQQAIQPMPQHLAQQIPQYQGPPMGQQTGQHFLLQPINYSPYQQPVPGQSLQSTQHQPPHTTQGPVFPYKQENNVGYQQQNDVDALKRKQTVFSPSQSDRTVNPSIQPPTSASNHMLQSGGVPSQHQPLSSSMHLLHHNPSTSYKPVSETVHQQHGLSHQNQMSPAMMHGHQTGFSNMGYEQHPQGRSGNDYFYKSKREPPAVASQDPKLAEIPIASNQQEMRFSGPPQNAPSGLGVGSVASAYGLPNLYNQGNGNMPISNHALGTVPPVQAMPPGFMKTISADAYCQQHEVSAMGDNVPPPFTTFEATGFPPEILREVRYLLQNGSICRTLHCYANNYMQQLFLWMLHNGFLEPSSISHLMLSAGFASPTPIQAQSWPIALQGRDIVAIAKTGSGKTLGYLIPTFIHLRQRRNNPLNGPTVLVLAPTRELATQIQDEAIKFGRSSRISCTCLYGGAPKGPQLKELDRGAEIVVATPGRLNDILEMKKIDFRQVSLLVLDEADRMLDMGFEPQIRKIVNEIPPRRQTLMYTATWPKEVRKIAGDLLVNPIQVNIGSIDELAANKSITQYIEVVPQMEKHRRLEQILISQERGSKIIIFCSTKKLCDELTRSIRRNFGAAAIHGDKSQGERDWVLNQFRSGKSPILVATDVAARGLDIKDIRVVINYDFPTGIEDYVHRIGRTGRAGATGLAYTFLTEHDWKYAPDLIKVLEGANQSVPPELREMAIRGPPSYGKDRGGVNRFDPHAGGGGGGRWDSGGRGGFHDGSFGSRGGGGFGARGGGFRDGGRGDMRDNFGGRGGTRDGFGGRGGLRDNYGGRGGRSDFFGGRAGPAQGGRGFGGPRGGGGNMGGWVGRDDRGPNDRFGNRDGSGRGRGRARFDDRRGDGPSSGRTSRGRSYSSSPEKVRTWGYSRSRSRSRSWSRSRSRSRSWSRSRSPRRSYSRDRSRSRSLNRDRQRSRSPSYGRYRGLERQNPEPIPEQSKDDMAPQAPEARPAGSKMSNPNTPRVDSGSALPSVDPTGGGASAEVEVDGNGIAPGSLDAVACQQDQDQSSA